MSDVVCVSETVSFSGVDPNISSVGKGVWFDAADVTRLAADEPHVGACFNDDAGVGADAEIDSRFRVGLSSSEREVVGLDLGPLSGSISLPSACRSAISVRLFFFFMGFVLWLWRGDGMGARDQTFVTIEAKMRSTDCFVFNRGTNNLRNTRKLCVIGNRLIR